MIKKNITINFCGRLYNIDEDAYELLNHYTESIRRYYSKIEGGEEVADDIEARIAELFDEQKAQGRVAIDIECTEAIIKRIGELEEITEPDDSEGSDNGSSESGNDDDASTTERIKQGANAFANTIADSAQNAWDTIKSEKKYFRDGQNALLAGVLAGAAQYFGGSLLMWRIIFLVLILIPIPVLDWFGIGGILVVGYIIMAIIAPVAEKPEERLQMQGRSVTPQNIAEEVSKPSRNGTSTLARFLSVLLKIVLCIVGIWLVIIFVGLLGFIAVFFTEPVTWFSTWWNWDNGSYVYDAVKELVWIAGGCGICALGILIYCTFHAIASSNGKVRAMGFGQRMAWFAAFIVCIIVMIAACFKTMTSGRHIEEGLHHMITPNINMITPNIKIEYTTTMTQDSIVDGMDDAQL